MKPICTGILGFKRTAIFGLLVIIGILPLDSIAQRVSPIKITAANANAYRDSLNLKIFGTTAFPYTILPDSVYSGVNSIDHLTNFPYASITYPNGNLLSIDKYVVSYDPASNNFPNKAKVYVFRPRNSNGKLFIYHSGHCAGTAIAEDVFANNNGVRPGLVIPALIERGFTVLAVPMPHYQQWIPSNFVCGFNGHDQLFQDSLYNYPFALFFKPLIASLNQLGRSNYSGIYMTGLSGGGWATSIYPAIDSSIQISVPVAGSWPMALRAALYSEGDAEQYFPPIFSGFLDYHDLYTLSCLAPARKMLQINNRYDNCCFNGAATHIFYVDSVAKVLQGTGGEFKYYLDETGTNHAITQRAVQVMLAYINGEQAQLINPPPDSIYSGMNYNYNIRNNFSVNINPVNSLSFSLLKAPEWMNINLATGVISGQVLPGAIIPIPDSASFKVEDELGRFVVYNFNFIKKRSDPFLFTMQPDSQTVFLVPFYSQSLTSIDLQSRGAFFFNNPLLQVTELSLQNNSIIKLKLNMPLSASDSIGYNGFGGAFPVRYANGLRMEDFSVKPIRFNAVNNNYARGGMIRFNTDTRKFEYYNGVSWVNMH
jgi:hypothetical protein